MPQEKGYYESSLPYIRCGNNIITPDKFIPPIAQFNLSQRFDMQQVLETLFFSSLQAAHWRAALLRESASPHTLKCKKDSATQIISLLNAITCRRGDND